MSEMGTVNMDIFESTGKLGLASLWDVKDQHYGDPYSAMAYS